MAYCRFSRQSDLYIYEDIGRGLTCCGCWLGFRRTPGGHGESFSCPTRSGMLAHIETHRVAGHKIEAGVLEQLREEIVKLGDTVSAENE